MSIHLLSLLSKHKKLVAAGLVGVTAAGIIYWNIHRVRTAALSDSEDLSYARTVFLQKGNLNESVNVSGLVQSAEVSSVTTALTSKVTAVNVKVGDQVNKGDVICTLDDSDLRKSIQDKQKELNDQKQTLQDAYNKALEQVNAAKNAKTTEQNNQNTLLQAARNARDAATAAVDNVTPAYNTAKANYDTMMKAVSGAQNEADTAAANRQNAYNAWIAAGGATSGAEYDAYQAADELLNQKNEALANARTLYDYDSYAAAYEQAKQAYDAAVAAKNEAQGNYDQAQNAANQALDACDTTINTAVSALQDADKALKKGVDDSSLKELEKSLDDTVLKAETSGKVTDLKVNVGSLCKGDVATIQSTDQLVLSVSIPEYAIEKVQVGMPVNITSDASSTPLTGKVSRISPTATTGDGTGSSNGFSADISIDQPNGIFIGSKAKAEIVVSSKSDVYSVPLDAVGQNDNGQDIIFIKQADNTFAPVVVTIGSKNDYSVEISGSDLTDDAEVLADATLENVSGDPALAASSAASTAAEGEVPNDELG